MKKKIIVKALGIAAILVSVVLLLSTVQSVTQGNRYYDLFRKIGVNIHDAYKEIDQKGVDQVKEDYRGVYALVDEMDALGGKHIKAALDGVNATYGLVDTVAATESIVNSIHAVGIEEAEAALNDVYDAIGDAEKAAKAVKDVGVDNAGTYLEDVKSALEDEPEDLTAARALVEAGYTELDEETKETVDAFFDYVFQLAADKGTAPAMAYLDALLESSDLSSEDFAQLVLEENILAEKAETAAEEAAPAAEEEAEPAETAETAETTETADTTETAETVETAEADAGDSLRQYRADVFRLIDDQGSAAAKTYIQNVIKTLKEKDISDARAYLDQVYEDNAKNHDTRQYLDAIFQVMDSQGAEYAKLNGGDIYALVNQDAVAAAQAFLTDMDALPAAGTQRERLDQLIEAISGAEGLTGNLYASDVLSIQTEASDAITAAEKAVTKAEKSAASLETSQANLDAAKAAVSAAATEEEKTAAQEALEKAQKSYDTTATRAQRDKEDAAKKEVTEDVAAQYVARIEEALADAKVSVSPEGLERVKIFQNHLCQLIGAIGADKAKKYTENAYNKVYNPDKWDKTLRLDRLGTDNAQILEELDNGKVDAMRGKARRFMLTAACLIVGLVLLLMRISDSAQPKLSREERSQMGGHMGLKTSRMLANSAIHILLIVISVVWLIPFISILLQSLRVESTHQVGYIMPDKLQLYNYVDLFTNKDFPRWYANTFIMALVVAVLQTIIVLCMSYTLSRFRFKMRKPLMRFMLILGMFPGMLTMIILYRVLKDLGLTQEHAVPGLILVYIASSGMGYYVSKGFFDTIPKSLDEAARVDGATRFQVLKKIILPLSKPIVIYTILTAFMGPWGDYVFARYISFGTSSGMNVAVGLYSWLSKDQIASRYTMFCAGGVLVAIPVAVLFMCLQKYYVEGVTGGAVKG